MRASAGVALGGALALALLAGCGGGAAAPLDAVVINESWPGCTEDEPSMAGREAMAFARMPADFVPVRITVCSEEFRRQADGREDLVVVERTGTEFAAVLATLDTGDERLSDGPCTADIKGAPWFMLADASGRWLRPHVPVDACSQPHQGVGQVVESLRLTERRVRFLRTVESAAAARTGCLQQSTDMVGYATRVESATPAVVGRALLPPAPTRLCRYDMPEDQRGVAKGQGAFSSGGPMSPTALSGVNRELLALEPATGACDQAASRFATLWPQRKSSAALWLELDGCRRVVWEANGYKIAQGSAALMALLET